MTNLESWKGNQRQKKITDRFPIEVVCPFVGQNKDDFSNHQI
jgi:hypothetical protein